VAAQGDMRPMAASKEAMDDLRAILVGRAAFYAKAEIHINTSAQSLPETYGLLDGRVRALIRF
jgi:XRE family transcriptional regulator, aerobic/anaerobic benzoate catabolism transcriptional regulator